MIVRDALDNGIRLVTESMGHVRSVSLGVWLTSGSRHESEEDSGELPPHGRSGGNESAEVVALQRASERLTKYSRAGNPDSIVWHYRRNAT